MMAIKKYKTINDFDQQNPLILYSFRRCPYAIRSRMSLYKSGFIVELREIELKNKPEQMLETSPKGTVPVLVLSDGTIIDESLDIMEWALDKSDPDGWLDADEAEMKFLIDRNDNKFKEALDRYKYPSRYLNEDCIGAREVCTEILNDLNNRLKRHQQILSDNIAMADIALFPFIRQCAFVDKEWFNNLPVPRLQQWLQEHLESTLFKTIMMKFKIWSQGDQPTLLKPPRG
jgi:glutathione S-transferase